MIFSNISSSLGKGQSLIVKNPRLSNLTELPKELPILYNLKISSRELNSNIPVPQNFSSFKGLPDFLPLLKSISLYDSTIPNFESLTAKMPVLKGIALYNCYLKNLKGIPKNVKILELHDCTINSFEGINTNDLNIINGPKIHISFKNLTFSSLHGISRPSLHSILIEYFSRFGGLYNNANLTIKGMQLLNDCINSEIYNRYCPIEFIRRNFFHIAPSSYSEPISFEFEIKRKGVDFFVNILNEHGIEYSGDWNEDKVGGEYSMEDWIYALSLEEKIFIPEKINSLFQFFQRSPIDLMFQYCSNSKSLTKPQILRLIHEADIQTFNNIINNYQCSNLSQKDFVLRELFHKFSVNIKNGKIIL